MRGKLLKKDDRVRWFISSANRDPNMFEKPDTFDIARWPNQQWIGRDFNDRKVMLG
jgi:cytochrome P450